jgi:phage-related protein
VTVKEVEIVVTAKVEKAVQEVMKLAPQIKKAMKQVQEAFEKVDTKKMQSKFQQATQFMKKKIQEIKQSTQNCEIAIKVNNKEAQQQISQIEKEIDSLKKKITSRELKLDITNNALDKIRADTNQSVRKDMPNAGNKAIKQETYKRLDNNTNYTTLVAQSDKLNKEIEKYNSLLNVAEPKMSQLKQETSQTATTQNKLSSFFGAFKGKLEQTKGSVGSFKDAFKQMPKLAQNITNKIKGMGKGLKQGLGHILKYAGSLFSLQNIYSTLSGCAQSWLSSQNAGAQQLSTNIEYMKYAMGSAFAPIIQWVINLVYQLMKAIQSVVYALFKVNIFANASAKSYGAMAGSAKKAKEETKQLAGIHDEINNIQSDDNSDSGSESGGGIAPSFDLSNVDPSNSIIEAIKNGNWYEVGGMIGQKLNEAMDSIPWDKIQNAAKQIGTNIANFLNGFIATTNWNQVGNTLAQGLNTIIYFGYSFVTTFDWRQFGKAIGDKINGFFSNVDWATAGQTLGYGIIGIFNSISSFLATVDWTVIGESIKTFIQNIDWKGIWEAIKETIKNAIGAVDGILTGLFGENIASIIEAIAIAIGSVVLALTAWSIIQAILNAVLMVSPITWIVIAITAVIAIIVLCIQHWNEICEVVSNVVNVIVSFIQELWNQVAFVFEAIWEVISTILGFIWNLFMTVFEAIWNIVSPILEAMWQVVSTIFQAVWNIISSVLGSVWNIFSQIFNWIWELTSKVFQGIWNIISPIITAVWEGIKTALNGIQQVWSSIWNTVSNVVRNVWNGIWSCIKGVINTILGGIEKFVNGAIRGINFLLSGISSIANAVGSLIGLSPINLKINTISLPRLAKGGVLTEATAVIAGEYSGASTNPEIVTPQNIMEETFDKVMSKYQGNNNGQPLHLQMYWGSKKIVDEIIDGINEKTRQTGKLQIKYT